MAERTKFYSDNDLGNTLQLSRAECVLAQYQKSESCININDAIELYNIKMFVDHHLFLKSWSEYQILDYVEKTKAFGRNIIEYFRGNLNEENALAIYDSLEFEYKQDFWIVIEKFGLQDKLTSKIVQNILSKYPDDIQYILHCEKLVRQFDNELAVVLMSYSISARLLIYAYWVTDLDNHRRKLFIPMALTSEQKMNIISSYLDSGNASLELVHIIMQSKDTEGLTLDAKIRLKAKKLEPELNVIPEGAIVSQVQTGFSIEYRKEKNIPPVKEWLKDLVFCYEYSEEYLDGIRNSSLLGVVRELFHFFSDHGLLELCYNKRENSFFEAIVTTEIKGMYRMNDHFRLKNDIAVSKIALFDKYLRRRGSRLEDVMKLYYEEYFKQEYGYPAPSLNFPADGIPSVNKNEIIAPEMEAVIKQYNLFVNEGEIDPELYEMSMAIPITLGKSAIKPHKYAVVKQGLNEIYTPMNLLFSDQTLLSFVEPYKNDHYHTLYNLLHHVGKVKYDNYENHQKPKIDYLLEKGYLRKENGYVMLDNLPGVECLWRLYHRGEITCPYCNVKILNEIESMVAKGWVEYDDYLLSPKERHYFNFMLNNSEYSNGMMLRNIYSHGATSCLRSDAEHKNVYYYFLMLFAILLLKIDEDFKISKN